MMLFDVAPVVEGPDARPLHRDGDGGRGEFLGHGAGVRGIHVQVVAGDHIEVVPELMVEILLGVHLRVEELHHLDDGARLLGALLLVGDGLELLHHLEDVASVFGHGELLAGSVVIQGMFGLVQIHIVLMSMNNKGNHFCGISSNCARARKPSDIQVPSAMIR